MAHDEALADRIRDLLAGQADVSERRMFGGVAFMVDGRMAVAASGQGGVMVRVDPGRLEHLLATTTASPMEMRGREMRGWLRIDAEHLRTKRQLTKWVDLGTTFARTLPAEPVRARRPRGSRAL